MFLLKRTISAYTGADLLLGVYRTVERAQAERQVYIELTAGADPFAEQAYVEVDLQADTIVVPLEGEPVAGPEVFIVSDVGEGFGQVVRHVCGGYGTMEAAARAGNAVERSSFPQSIVIERLAVDAPPRQPIRADPYGSPIDVGWCREE